jgi:integrase
MKRPRYQFGSLYTESRKNGPDVWVYRWRETNLEGRRQLRKQILGTVQEIQTQDDALRAAETYRLSANRNTGDHIGTPPTLRKLIEHYKLKEMPMDNHEGKRRSTKLNYLSNLDNHILPRWGEHHPARVAAIEIEEWIKSLRLAPASRAKVRNVFSMIFRHGIRWGWLDKNPVAMVRVSSKRLRRPDVLTAEEFRLLLAALPERDQLMGMICATTGMRIGEVLGLKWRDIHFESCEADVLRSFSDGAIGPCRTEISKQPVPLDDILIEGLREWHQVCGYPKPDDWVFAYLRQDSTLARQPSYKGASTHGAQSRNHQEDRVAYLPAHLQLVAGCDWRRCESGAGADAPCQDQHNDGGLRAGGHGEETSRAAPRGRCADGSETQERYRRVDKTGKFPDCSRETVRVPGSCGLSY